MRTVLCLLAVALPGAQVQPDPQLIGASRVSDGAVTFSLEEFAWRESAPAPIRRLEAGPPGAALRAELPTRDDGFGSALFPFPVPVPGGLRSRNYLLIHAGGATELRLDSLRGTARFRLADSTSAAPSLQYYGDAFASPRTATGPIGGGIVVVTPRPIRATVRPSHYTPDQLLGPGDYFERGTKFWAIQTQFAVVLGSDLIPYVFVQWGADDETKEAGCRYRFALFRLSPTPKIVASSDYGCDV